MAGRPRQKGRVRRKPELSQHFIKGAETARRLVALARIKSTDLVVEAGPGNGALTTPLAAVASQVLAVEADRTLYKRLARHFSSTANVTIRPGDFLKFSLPSGPYTFFASIPFARTADIVRKLVFGESPPQDAYIVLEAAAAQRFLGQPFGPESTVSLTLKAFFQPSVLAWLGPGAFSPPPSVNSVMLRLHARKNCLLQASELRDFERFARTVFASQHRSAQHLVRKLLPRPMARSLVSDLNFPATAPPSSISFEQWLTVFRLSEWGSGKA